jgi:HlyD family secretion protein
MRRQAPRGCPAQSTARMPLQHGDRVGDRNAVAYGHEMRMAGKKLIAVYWVVPILLVASLGYYLFVSDHSAPAPLLLSTAARHELKVVIGTNGIIEPADRIEIYAPIDAFVTDLHHPEGSEVSQGKLLMHLESQQLKTTLAEANAALLQARREAQQVVAGPPREEVAAVEAAIAEAALQLGQQREDLRREEALLSKEATTREVVENLRKQVSLLQLRLEGFQQKKQVLLNRHSDTEKQLVKTRVDELTRQVELLEQQIRLGSVVIPINGLLYSLPVRSGSYVNKGQLLAQIYQPGRIQLRAYVDEPDLGRVDKGQQVLIDWDGLPDRQWTGTVDKLAKQVVALGNRSVGYVICSIKGEPKELIPNINVKIQIVTASRAAALVVPRTAVFNANGKPTVMLSSDGLHTVLKPVLLGLITPEEVEIVQGIDEGSKVVTNPGEPGLK